MAGQPIHRSPDEIVGETLQPVAGGIAIVFALALLVDLGVEGRPLLGIDAFPTFLALLGFLGIYLFIVMGDPGPGWSQPMAAVMVLLAIMHILSAAVMDRTLAALAPLNVVVLGAGVLFLSTTWHRASVGASLAAFFAGATLVPSGSDITGAALTLLGATVLSWVIHDHRLRNLERIRVLRDEDALRNRQLESLTRELQQTNEDLQSFTYAASHDLKAPLRTVKRYTTLLERRLDDRLEDEERELMAFVTDGVDRMENLIQALLQFARAGREHEPPRPVLVKDALDDALENLRGDLQETNATVDVDLDGLPPVLADRTSFSQVLQNLVDNAIRYHDGTDPHIRIWGEVTDGTTKVFVADEGPGIPPEHRARVFEPFQRLHGYEDPGSGLGLATCKRIVERHGGTIEVDSAANGKGTCFTLTFPHRSQAGSPTRQEPPE